MSRRTTPPTLGERAAVPVPEVDTGEELVHDPKQDGVPERDELQVDVTGEHEAGVEWMEELHQYRREHVHVNVPSACGGGPPSMTG